MAKKGAKSSKSSLGSDFKKIFQEFAEKSTQVIITTIESVNPIKLVKDLINFKKLAFRYSMVLVLFLAGIIVFALGIADYLVSLWPSLQYGLGKIIVGLILLIITFIVYKLKR